MLIKNSMFFLVLIFFSSSSASVFFINNHPSEFFRGIYYYSAGFDVRACRSIMSEKKPLCFEGYTYVMSLRGAPFFQNITDFDYHELRGIYTGLGLGAARKIAVDKLLRVYGKTPFIYQILDGWGFGQTAGPLKEPGQSCGKLSNDSFRRVCLFGVGRASYFFSIPATASPEFTSGYNFAKNAMRDNPMLHVYRNNPYLEMLHSSRLSKSETERLKNYLYSCLQKKKHIAFCD